MQGNGILERHGATLKFVFLGTMALFLMIPVGMVMGLIHEREARKNAVMEEIASKWGKPQTLGGPVLRIPYTKQIETEKGKTVRTRRDLYILPETHASRTVLDPEIRYRSIYESVVYRATCTLDVTFALPETHEDGDEPERILYDEAELLLALADTKGILEPVRAVIGGDPVDMALDPRTGFRGPAIAAPVKGVGPGSEVRALLTIKLKGSGDFGLYPLGKQVNARVESSWNSPGFKGAYLPDQQAVTDAGFTADWRILHYNVPYPQTWWKSVPSLEATRFGVSLLIPADTYQQAQRSAKYSILFVVFTFMGFFMAEVLNRTRIHPVQYFMVGCALVVFYLLLLSLSEHIRFGVAYSVSAASVIALVSIYARGVLRSARLAGATAGILSVLYGLLYILLQLEEFALVTGSVAVFTILAAFMLITRNTDWYSIRLPEPATLRDNSG